MTHHVSVQVGRRLRALRRYRGETQEDLARRMQELGFAWSAPIVSRAETGVRSVLVDEVDALAYVLMVDLVELVRPSRQSVEVWLREVVHVPVPPRGRRPDELPSHVAEWLELMSGAS